MDFKRGTQEAERCPASKKSSKRTPLVNNLENFCLLPLLKYKSVLSPIEAVLLKFTTALQILELRISNSATNIGDANRSEE